LDLLREENVLVPTPADLEQKGSMRVEADQACVDAKASHTDVVKVDAKDEVAKERPES